MREALEEAKSQASKREKRVMASYKESKGFQCSLQHSGQAIYEFRYHIIIGRFKARYLELEVDKDPYIELRSDVKVSIPV